MILNAQSKFNIDRAFKFCIVLLVILSLMLSWFCIPKADAIAGTILIAGTAVALETIISVLCTLILTTVGVDFACGYYGGTDFLGTGAYEIGNKLSKTVSSWSHDAQSWILEQVERFTDKGGFASNDSITVPAEVLENARSWVNEEFDFASGALTITANGILDDNGNLFQFFPWSEMSTSQPLTNLAYYGSIVPVITVDPSATLSDLNDTWKTYNVPSINGTKFGSFHSETMYTTGGYVGYWGSRQVFCTSSTTYLGLSFNNNKIYHVSINTTNGTYYVGDFGISVSNGINTSDTTVNGTGSLANPQTQDKTVYIPDLPIGTISGFNVPIIEQLTQDMVIDGTVPDVGTEDDPDVGEDDEEKPAWVPDKNLWDKLTGWIDKSTTLTDSITESNNNNLNDTVNNILPLIKDGFGFVNIWHYVVSWVGSIGAFLGMLFTVWSGLPYAMVVPIYATAVIVIVIGMYRRFFM